MNCGKVISSGMSKLRSLQYMSSEPSWAAVSVVIIVILGEGVLENELESEQVYLEMII